jgi:hypothetical protein
VLVDGPAGRVPVTYVVATNQVLEFQYEDGRRVVAPLAWYPRLLHGSPAERNSWELKLGGRVVLWRSLGFGIAAKALVAGTKSDENRKSVNAWLAGRKVANGKRKAG